jgi:hypothetical protein
VPDAPREPPAVPPEPQGELRESRGVPERRAMLRLREHPLWLRRLPEHRLVRHPPPDCGSRVLLAFLHQLRGCAQPEHRLSIHPLVDYAPLRPLRDYARPERQPSIRPPRGYAMRNCRPSNPPTSYATPPECYALPEHCGRRPEYYALPEHCAMPRHYGPPRRRVRRP